MAVNPARAAAHESLMKLTGGRYTNLEVNVSLERHALSDADRGLYTNLVYGVTERLLTLDHIIGTYSETPIEKIDAEVLASVRMGLYQLLYCDRIPDHAAVNESVELTGKRAKGYVNAILRRFLADSKKIKYPTDRIKKLSVMYSVPEELVKLFSEWYPADAERIMASFLEKEKISVSVNTLKTGVEEAVKMLSGEVSDISGRSIVKDSFDNIREGIDSGLWFVQDTSSAFAASVVGARPGETVVDTCSAPGGKSFYMALDMENRGEIYSFDLHENKLSLIKKGAKKLGIDIIRTEARDARNAREDLIGKADRVLCDAPCSGLGVIGKKPDIRYKDPKSIENFPRIQKEILRGAAKYVKSGGTLVYSTCTLNPNENEKNVEEFLLENPDFSPCEFEYRGETMFMKTFLPDKDGTDGFFVAKMMKK